MRKMAARLLVVLSVLPLTACTPFFYGGVVILGDPADDMAESGDEKT
jgi:hypothetical protein